MIPIKKRSVKRKTHKINHSIDLPLQTTPNQNISNTSLPQPQQQNNLNNSFNNQIQLQQQQQQQQKQIKSERNPYEKLKNLYLPKIQNSNNSSIYEPPSQNQPNKINLHSNKNNLNNCTISSLQASPNIIDKLLSPKRKNSSKLDIFSVLKENRKLQNQNQPNQSTSSYANLSNNRLNTDTNNYTDEIYNKKLTTLKKITNAEGYKKFYKLFTTDNKQQQQTYNSIQDLNNNNYNNNISNNNISLKQLQNNSNNINDNNGHEINTTSVTLIRKNQKRSHQELLQQNNINNTNQNLFKNNSLLAQNLIQKIQQQKQQQQQQYIEQQDQKSQQSNQQLDQKTQPLLQRKLSHNLTINNNNNPVKKSCLKHRRIYSDYKNNNSNNSEYSPSQKAHTQNSKTVLFKRTVQVIDLLEGQIKQQNTFHK